METGVEREREKDKDTERERGAEQTLVETDLNVDGETQAHTFRGEERWTETQMER